MIPETTRIAVLYSELAGYVLACWKQLKERHNVELLVFHWKPAPDAPFDLSQLSWIDHLHSRESLGAPEMTEIARAFKPHGVFMAGWIDPGYLQVARSLRAQGVPVVAGLDTQWKGSLRQRVGCLTAPRHLHSAIDILWATGERQAQFARGLGYRGDKCWYGLYCCDWEKFACQPFLEEASQQQAFLYVGRYVEEKGLAELIKAYAKYRATVESPWNLICAGAGALKPLLTNQEGITDSGFSQPDALPALMRDKASAFILPSRKEPWGVVLQEAAASGLPLIASDACGAAVHLLQDGYNGFLFEAGNADHLAQCMVRLHKANLAQRVEMGQRSYELSKQFTPQRWADTLMHGLSVVA